MFARYEELKRTHLRTADLCAEVGLRFTPCVLEAHGGGWNGAVRGLVEWMAGRTAASQHMRPEAESLRIAQRIRVSLQRENARARSFAASSRPAPTHSCWAGRKWRLTAARGEHPPLNGARHWPQPSLARLWPSCRDPVWRMPVRALGAPLMW